MMYKVMLVDDDYPVLEFLSEIVEWKTLGLHLQSIHENGVSALNYAATNMPDILITDIGMPKMNGLELTQRMKEKNDNLQVAILSCHNEFKYAQHAVSLKVQDYLLKETLDPQDLTNILLKYKEKLEEKNMILQNQIKLKRQLTKSNELVKERFFQQIIHQPQLIKQDIRFLESNLGYRLENKSYLPVLCQIDNYLLAKTYFTSENMLRYAMNNVIDEMIQMEKEKPISFNFESNKIFILFPMSTSLKINNYDHMTNILENIQHSLNKFLRVPVSFLIGNKVKPLEFKYELTKLSMSTDQLFYLKDLSIVLKKENLNPSKEDLFLYYSEAIVEFRNLIFSQKIENIKGVVSKWMNFIRKNRFPESMVKDWVLKILLELMMKIKSLQSFQLNKENRIIHHEILSIYTLNELSDWLISYLRSVIQLMSKESDQTKHKEILRACAYIYQNIEGKLSLDEVANYVYLNTSYFSRLFRQEMGVTFIEYITTLKVERAKELLDQTDDFLGEICEKLGYDNQSYFIKLFKDQVGYTPSEYRKTK